MPTFKPGDVVRVPFPYVDTPVREVRPALVISSARLGPQKDLFWAVMITSAANKGWPGDVSIEQDHRAFGLPAPSVIRTEKIAVLEIDTASRLGRVSDGILADVQSRIAGYLGLRTGGMMARTRQTDVDRPCNLAKGVTVAFLLRRRYQRSRAAEFQRWCT